MAPSVSLQETITIIYLLNNTQTELAKKKKLVGILIKPSVHFIQLACCMLCNTVLTVVGGNYLKKDYTIHTLLIKLNKA